MRRKKYARPKQAKIREKLSIVKAKLDRIRTYGKVTKKGLKNRNKATTRTHCQI